MSIELKPCPFCGGEAKAREWAAWSPTIQGVTSVACTECAAEIEVDAAELWLHDAAWYWNSRAERTCRKLPSSGGKECTVTHVGTGLSMSFGYWKCSECGCECFEGARYCMGCGAKVVEG